MNLFSSIFTSTFTVGQFLLAIIISIFAGLLLALGFKYKTDYSKSFISSLLIIPAIETVVIMLVNDNLGVGLSVAGSFALIRFRSVKGSAKELSAIFAAMTIGIICGTGYVALGIIFSIIVSGLMIILNLIGFGTPSNLEKYLKITIPESINYEEALEPILKKYTSHFELQSLKTLTLGSLFRVEYKIELKKNISIKKMIDELRIRNSNLEIICGNVPNDKEEL